MKLRSPRLLALGLMVSSTTMIDAATIHVDGSASGLDDGSSWTHAFVHLQDALAAAQPGDAIFVAEGIYRPDQGAGQTPGDRGASFELKSGVEVYGAFLGFEPTVAARVGSAEKTVLSGDLAADDGSGALADNSNQVVTGFQVDGAAVLDGFTITGGNAVYPGQIVGAGIFLVASRPRIVGCRIVGNRCTEDGAGVTIVDDSQAAIIDCDFIGNVAGDVGGGLWTNNAVITVVNSRFLGNAGRSGGGIYFYAPDHAPSSIVNCVFSGNSATDEGGMMYVGHPDSSPRLVGCTASGNNAGGDAGGIRAEASTEIRGCVLYGNADAFSTGESAQVGGSTPAVVAYSCIGGLATLGGPGNIGADPMFADADGVDGVVGTPDDDLSLLPGSPCLDAGDSSAFPPDEFDLDADLNVLEPTSLDVAGAPRFVDDPAPDVGVGPAPVVDMGAYESGVTAWFTYGQGCVGSGGFIPTLTLSGVPAAGSSVSLIIGAGLGGSTAVILLGTGQAAAPIGGGCFLNVAPVLPAMLIVPLAGVGPGAGTATLFGPLPPGSTGVTFTMQAFVAEPSLPTSYSNTKGLQMTIQ